MPFEVLSVGAWVIEVDREATHVAYRQKHRMDVCACAYCKNFVAACLAQVAYSSTSLAFFERLGIAPEKGAEVCSLSANQEKTHVFYGGFYHCVGRLVKRPEEATFTVIDDPFKVLFTERILLVSRDFPQPVVQMEWMSSIPWVLDEKELLLNL